MHRVKTNIFTKRIVDAVILTLCEEYVASSALSIVQSVYKNGWLK